MSNKELNQVIKTLKEEQNLLKNLLKDSLRMMDYAQAHLYQNSLAYTIEKLNILEGIKNPNHQKKEYLIQTIKISKARLKKEIPEYLAKFINERLNHDLNELENIKRNKVLAIQPLNNFETCLNDLKSFKIKGFKIFLKESLNFYLNFKVLKKSILVISLSNLKDQYENYFILKPEILIGLGFVFDETKNMFIYQIALKNVLIKDVKILTSRVFFDLRFNDSLDQNKQIQIVNK